MAGKWYKGMPSPNPKGRPPRERSLTNLIERVMSKRMYDPTTGSQRSRKVVFAELLAEATTRGRVTFPGDEGEPSRVVLLNAEEWTSFVMRLLNHVDGPARAGIDLDVGDVTYRIQFVPSPGQRVAGDAGDEDAGNR